MIDAGEHSQHNQQGSEPKTEKPKTRRKVKNDPLKDLKSERELLTALLEKEGYSYEAWLKEKHDEAIRQRYRTISDLVKEA